MKFTTEDSFYFLLMDGREKLNLRIVLLKLKRDINKKSMIPYAENNHRGTKSLYGALSERLRYIPIF